jgi:hypothetical protein
MFFLDCIFDWMRHDFVRFIGNQVRCGFLVYLVHEETGLPTHHSIHWLEITRQRSWTGLPSNVAWQRHVPLMVKCPEPYSPRVRKVGFCVLPTTNPFILVRMVTTWISSQGFLVPRRTNEYMVVEMDDLGLTAWTVNQWIVGSFHQTFVTISRLDSVISRQVLARLRRLRRHLARR